MNSRPIIGVYLAAGKSKRMGKNKLALPIGDAYIGSLAFEAALASKLDWTIAVTRPGDQLEWLAPFSKKEGWSMLQCYNADNGQSASLKAGVKEAMAFGAGALVILLADQPFVTSGIINRLLDKYREPFTAAAKNGMPVPPIVISQMLFPALMELTGDTGARSLIRNIGNQGLMLELDAKVFKDVDSVEDYHNLLQMGGVEIGCHREKCDSQGSF